MKKLLVTLFLAFLPLAAQAQLDDERCTTCVDNCSRTDPYCGQQGTQFCGLWNSADDNWLEGTVTPMVCVNCPRFDPECSPYKARPATAPSHFQPHCTDCRNDCPRTDPYCGRPGTQWCGLADREANQWVAGTVKAYQCRPRGPF